MLALALVFIATLLYQPCITASNPFLDESELKDSQKIQTLLKAQGFEKYFFESPDHLKLCGLLQDQSKSKKIQATILYCAGFYPGTKEGMSSFYTLFADQPFNFFMFDARGHQESDGRLFSYQAIKNYGTCEYQDVIGALTFLNAYNKKHDINPAIIIHGICSGAFHCVKALDTLQSTFPEESKNVKGIIFDSGWLQMSDIVEPTICAEITKKLQGGWFSWLIKPLCFITLNFYRLTLQKDHAAIPSITDCLSQTSCPILFIHCINDPYVPIKPVQKFLTTKPEQPCWWIDHDSHTNFHVHNPQKYTENILKFIDQVLI